MTNPEESPHLKAESLAGYLDGHDEGGEMDAHLRGCADCAKEASELALLLFQNEQAVRDVLVPEDKRRFYEIGKRG